MTSLKQIEANRRNALRSTGPITPEGKQRSRSNAYRHGLTAETVVTGFEHAEDYEAFQLAVASEYDAQTATERELVLRLASLLWRLRRATAIETALFEIMAGRAVESGHGPTDTRAPEGTWAGRAFNLPGGEFAGGFLQMMELPTCPLDRLSRYEYTLWRQARQIMTTLQSLMCRSQMRARFGYSRLPGTAPSQDE